MRVTLLTGAGVAAAHPCFTIVGLAAGVDVFEHTGLEGDVLRYIALLQRVDLVIKHGVRYR